MTVAALGTEPPSLVRPTIGACRGCGAAVSEVVVDLGMSPLCESFLPPSALNGMESFYPLVVYVCDSCFLVQLDEYVPAEEIFTDYAYFSSFSDSWIEHGRVYTEKVVARLGLDTHSHVVELASNDGYLLQHFIGRGIPALGIEPAANVAATATERGVPTLVEFFTAELARTMVSSGQHADLVIGNNVLAQVPDLRDFVRGVSILLANTGTATFEFPHLRSLLDGNQFDTIYHEHFSYFSLLTLAPILRREGLEVVDVEELTTHGGSLRLYVQHATVPSSYRIHSSEPSRILRIEQEAGLDGLDAYRAFGARVQQVKRDLLRCLGNAKDQGLAIVGYGAPGKGNTLLNYCGIRGDYLEYTVDRNPHKHGRFLPGTHIPIHDPERIFQTRPDLILILPWNLRHEIMEQMSEVRSWGARFVIPIPSAEIVP